MFTYYFFNLLVTSILLFVAHIGHSLLSPLQCVCRSCGASSDPLPFTELVHYVSTTALW